ncbi:AEC family transporter [Penaeicola halotolerans]|uniref:AEC family transporter n=1 Tax=Penaeicola halotolerans TaxID=2793196 RepID=UPI001CF8A745|nr:AEC family transporter [Penaeicola halotolerans]
MTNLYVLALCLILGLLFQRVKDFPSNAHITLNNFIIYVSLPALALVYIPQITYSLTLIYPLMTAWIIFGAAVLIFGFLGPRLGWDRATTGCVILCCGLGNTSFVGYPLVEALFGVEGLQYAILVDQPGSFVIVSSFGIVVAAVYGRDTSRKRDIFKKVLKFPPFLTFVLAFILGSFDIKFEGVVADILSKIGATLTPLALVSVGLQLKVKATNFDFRPLLIGLSYKLFLAPFLIFALYVWILGGEGMPVDVSIIEAAMAPMITASIVASSNQLNEKLAGMMVGIGVPLSFFTVLLWYWMIG